MDVGLVSTQTIWLTFMTTGVTPHKSLSLFHFKHIGRGSLYVCSGTPILAKGLDTFQILFRRLILRRIIRSQCKSSEERIQRGRLGGEV